jgi:hypothetical protein
MATTGLFGSSPYELQQGRQAALSKAADAYGQTAPNDPYGFDRARSGLYMAGSQLGGGIASLLGVEDPEMKKASDLQAILQQFDTTTPQGLMQAGQAAQAKGYGSEAMQAFAKAQEMVQSQAITRKNVADATKTEVSARQEEQLRAELAALPANATEQDVMGIMVKYGSPDKVFAALQASQSRRDAQEGRVQTAQIAADARIEAAKLAGATAREIAQMRRDTAVEMAAIRAEDKKAAAANKPLAPSLQKGEDADLAQVDTLGAQQQVLKAAISSVTPDPKTGQSSLMLGPIRNMKYDADNATGNSTPESRAYANLKSSVDSAVNLQVSAEKGVQTDADVLRFAKALIASYGRNDTKATQEALVKYNNAINTAQNKLKSRIDSRRKSQGVDPYYKDEPTAGTAANPIKLK